jgi:cytidylate kinase
MGSYVEEFQGDRKKQSETVIAIAGPSKSGKSTMAKHVADELGIKHFSAGDFFREIADERGMTVEELSEKADRETDIEVDRRTLEAGLQEDCVIDGRLAAWVLGDFADLSIYVTADLKERAQRLADIEGIEFEKARERIEKRDRDNDERYMDYYGIDTSELEIYDVVMDNTELSMEEQNEVVDDLLEQALTTEEDN